MYTLFENVHLHLMQAGNDDSNFINIMANTEVMESNSDLTMETIFQEVNELIIKFDKFL